MNETDYSRQRVFNFELDPAPETGKQLVQMPKGADILGLIEKDGFPYLLAAVDETQPFETRIFRTVTTGEYFNREILAYIGTLRIGGPVVVDLGRQIRQSWYTMHVFELAQELVAKNPDPIDSRWEEDRDLLKTELAPDVGDYGQLND